MNKVNSVEPDKFEGGKKETPKRKGEGTPKKKGEIEEKILTPEEKIAKEELDARAAKKSKEILVGYVKKHKWLMFFGFVTNLFGMVGEFVSPLMIGWVVDAITIRDF